MFFPPATSASAPAPSPPSRPSPAPPSTCAQLPIHLPLLLLGPVSSLYKLHLSSPSVCLFIYPSVCLAQIDTTIKAAESLARTVQICHTFTPAVGISSLTSGLATRWRGGKRAGGHLRDRLGN